MAIGGTAGALISLILSTLDYFRIAYASWMWLAVPVVAGIVIGAVAGFFLRLRVNDLADSIDRRASLENRLGTATEEVQDDMRGLQRGDALAHLQSLKPSAVFPVRMTRWHGGLVSLSVLAASLFLLGNTPIFLSAKDKADRAELKQSAANIERVIKPLLERKPEEISPEVKKIAKDFDELKREMEKGRIPKEEAMQKANKLAEKAEKTAKEEAQKSEMQVATAQEQLEKLAENEAMKELGLSKEDFDESRMEKAKEMTEGERKEMTEELAKQLKDMQNKLGMKSESQQGQEGQNQKSEQEAMKDLEKQLSDIENQLKKGQDANGKQLSKSELEALKKLSEQLKELMKDLKMSQKLQDFIQKLQSMPEMKEINELLAKLAKAMQQVEQGDMEVPELTEQELADLKKAMQEKLKALEEAISKMTDEDIKQMMEDYKKALEEALKNGMQACQGGMCMMPGLLPGLPKPGMPKWGPSGPGQDNFYRDIGQIPLNEKGEDIKAGQMPISTTGQRQDKGEERYVEIRGPVRPGEKSKTPYFKVLPKYKKQAEDALDKDRIPKEHQKRVKDYFESLTGGGK